MPISMKTSAQTPAVAAVAGPSKTSNWDLTVNVTGVPHSTVAPQDAGLSLSFSDAPPTLLSTATNISHATLLGFLDQGTIVSGSDPWSLTSGRVAGLSDVSAAAGHHLYLSLYDTSAGADAPILAHADLGLIPA